MLRELAMRHYQHELRFTDYRAQRQIVLDRIDYDYNGVVRTTGIDEQMSKGQRQEQRTLRLGETMTFSTDEIVKATENTLTPEKTEHTTSPSTAGDVIKQQ